MSATRALRPSTRITIEPVTARYVKVLDVKSWQPGRKMALYEIELYDTEAEPAGLSPCTSSGCS